MRSPPYAAFLLAMICALFFIFPLEVGADDGCNAATTDGGCDATATIVDDTNEHLNYVNLDRPEHRCECSDAIVTLASDTISHSGQYGIPQRRYISEAMTIRNSMVLLCEMVCGIPCDHFDTDAEAHARMSIFLADA